VVIYHALPLEQIKKIRRHPVQGLTKRLEERRIGLEISDKAKEFLAHEGTIPPMGARPLKRTCSARSRTPWPS